MLALLALAASAGAQQEPCAFPQNLNGTEVWGLQRAASGDASPAACAAACCGNATCTLYQYCASGGACAPVGTCWVGALSAGQQQPVSGWVSAARAAPLLLDASAPAPPPAPIPGMPPVARADGSTLGITSAGLELSGVPLFAVAGEMHYSRVAQSGWAADLRTMRAGGLTTVSAYVVMIHHNEVKGVYDWSGSRNLTAFLVAAREAGLLVSLRIGPYAHGEVRGGGLPDWLQAIPGLQLRTSQPAFMQLVQTWYAAVAAQTAGHMWQEGGAVISMQLDNESGDGEYLVACRAAAVRAGLAPPFFTATGLNRVPFGSMLPLAGMYPVIFWDCGSGSGNGTSPDYLFARPEFEGSGYPTLWCELGGGIAAVYCARHAVAPMDIVATAYIAAARSSDLGYYMFHSGENPLGALSTLQERQAFYNGIWDLPVTGYDFVAPLRSSGAVHGHYHGLRALHQLTAALPWLPRAATALPLTLPASPTDATTLRWAARSDAATGATLLLFSTHARNLRMAPPQGARLRVALPPAAALANTSAGGVQVPLPASPPLDFPVGTAWAWPLALPLPGGLVLRYALAQPAGTVRSSSSSSSSGTSSSGSSAPSPPPAAPPAPSFTVLLLATPGIAPELALEHAGSLTVRQCSGQCSAEGGVLVARGLAVGRGSALSVLAPDGETVVTFVILASGEAARLWVGRLAGELRAVLTAPEDEDTLLGLEADDSALSVRSSSGGGGAVALSILPSPAGLSVRGGAPLPPPTSDGLFSRYTLAALPGCSVSASVALVRGGALPPPAPMGPRGHPTAPGNDGTLSDDRWAAAAVYSVNVSSGGGGGGGGSTLPLGADVRLRFDWVGDVARLYTSSDDAAPVSALLGDAFFNSPSSGSDGLWELSLTRALPQGTPVAGAYTLRVLPLRADASASVALDTWPTFGTGPGGSALELRAVSAVCTVSVQLAVAA
jgi:beta-galactosidase